MSELHINSDEAHKVTLQSYNAHLKEYLEKDHRDEGGRTVAYWPGVAYFLGKLKPGELVFEIGSGSGADARRIEQAGFRVQRSDAAESFLKFLQKQGTNAVRYDVLQQPPDQTFRAILANAVLLHFNTDQFRVALSNIHQGLSYDGLLCLGMKLGDFEGWRQKGLAGKRYFKFWRVPNLEEELIHAHFQVENSFVTSDGSFVVITAAKR